MWPLNLLVAFATLKYEEEREFEKLINKTIAHINVQVYLSRIVGKNKFHFAVNQHKRSTKFRACNSEDHKVTPI